MNYSGLTKYEEGLRAQETAFQKVKSGAYKGILIILEHSPVYTIGSGGGWDNLLQTKEFFDSRGIDLVTINRGGNVTFHGPGQIVAYPIFDLKHLKQDTHWYIESLEDVVINVLSDYGIKGTRKPQYRGTWVGEQKISAVGVHVKQWITTHGLSFNINVDKEYFNWINPCGIKEFGITSLEDYVENIHMTCIKKQLIQSFEYVFQVQFAAADKELLGKKD